MAKKSKARMKVALQCPDCGQRGYITQFNKINQPKLDDQNKYCNNCRKHTVHTMKKDLD